MKTEDINYKKLTPTAIAPIFKTDGAIAADLCVDSVEGPHETKTDKDGNEVFRIPMETRVKIHTGVAIEFPDGIGGHLYPRSGLACKQGLRLANDVGVIDTDYRGEIIAVMYADYSSMPNNGVYHSKDSSFSNHSIGYIDIPRFSRVCQIEFNEYHRYNFHEQSELDVTARGAGGFGSTKM